MAEREATVSAGSRHSWKEIPRAAKVFRVAHIAFGVVNMAGLAYVWLSAVARRRDRWLLAFVSVLCAEGAALVVGRGNCPLGPLQHNLGDPVPMFELVLPPRAAKAAIPVLAVFTFAGFAAVLLRPPVSLSRYGSAHRAVERATRTQAAPFDTGLDATPVASRES